MDKYIEYSTLLMFSGGITSTGLLVELLEAKTPNLLVHHVNIGDVRTISKVQHYVSVNIIKQLYSQYGQNSFSYSESTLNFRSTTPPIDKLIVNNLQSVCYAAGTLVHGMESINSIIIGNSGKFKNKSLKKAQVVFDSLQYYNPRFSQVEFTQRQLKETYGSTFEILSGELKSLVWSCDFPNYNHENQFLPCGTCVSCKFRFSELSKKSK